MQSLSHSRCHTAVGEGVSDGWLNPQEIEAGAQKPLSGAELWLPPGWKVEARQGTKNKGAALDSVRKNFLE